VLPGERGEILPGDPLYVAPVTNEILKEQWEAYQAYVQNGGVIKSAVKKI